MVWKPLVRSVGTLMKLAFCSVMVVIAVTLGDVVHINSCVEEDNAPVFASACCLPCVNLYTRQPHAMTGVALSRDSLALTLAKHAD
jgi:hypothetical protein